MQFVIKEVIVETVTKGRNKWQVANVSYTSNGEARTHKLLSFTNPDAFATVQTLNPGETVEVTITKNDQGYNQWAKVEKVDGAKAPAQAAPASGGRVTGSNYETPDERKVKQLYIARQNSVGNAVAMLTPGAKAPIKVDEVIELANQLVDYIYGVEEVLAQANAANQEVSFQ